MSYTVYMDYPGGQEFIETMPSPALAMKRKRLAETEGAAVAIVHEETGNLVYETDMEVSEV